MSEKRQILITIGLTLILLALNITVYAQNQPTPDILKVHFLDIGQGDSILIETPSGVQVLIDAGVNNSVISQLSQVMSFFDRTIDVVIPTHSDADHVGGFPETFRRYEIKNYFDSGFFDGDELNNEIRLAVQNEKEIVTQSIKRGDRIILDAEHNITLEILWPPENYETDDNNERSIVARLDYRELSFLFTGDAGIEAEEKMLRDSNAAQILDVDILKAGHHGSKTSSGIDFLRMVTPELTIISAGRDNKFGHPHQEVFDNLTAVGSQIKNTAEVGRILIESDGENYWVK